MKTQLFKNTLIAIALGGLGLAATGAQAQDNRDYGWRDAGYSHHDRYDHGAKRQSDKFLEQIETRQHRQVDRIRDGRESRQLTRHEFRELMKEQRDIRDMKEHFLADGIIDSREFRRIDRALDIASREIRAEKHDNQARNSSNRGPWYN